jgi:hypothetical protein
MARSWQNVSKQNGQGGTDESNKRLLVVSFGFEHIGIHFSYFEEQPRHKPSGLDPRGIAPAVERIPLSRRLARINGARICIVMSWPTNSAFDNVVKDLVPLLKERGAKEITVKPRNVRYSEDDPQLWDEMRQKCDAFIYVAAPSSSTTSYAFQWSAKLEKMGLPGAVVNFDDLNNVGDTTSSRWGAALRRSSFIYPPETMNKQAYAAALSRAIDNLTRPLTPDEKATGIIQPKPRLEVFVSGDFDQILKSFYDAG